MNRTSLVLLLFCLVSGSAHGTEHHSGHGGGAAGGGGGGSHCIKAHLSKFTPPHLSKVKPGSEFSFVVININSPKQVQVMVKKIPVEFDAEFKDPFYLVTAKLPEQLNNTMARIDVKITAKLSSCETENGWLVNIADN